MDASLGVTLATPGVILATMGASLGSCPTVAEVLTCGRLRHLWPP